MAKAKKVKKLKEGYVNVNIFDLDGMSITEPGFFEKYVPEGCELVDVRIYAEYGYYDEGDTARFVIAWKEKSDE